MGNGVNMMNKHRGSSLDDFLKEEGIYYLNVICVKWGDKYGPEYVNRLKSMMTKYCTRPFNMWCYTDDKYGIDYDIEIIDIPEDEMLEGWWNKVSVFKSNMPYEGRCLYLDLDTVIQNNIDDLIYYKPYELCGVWTYWNEVWTDGDYEYATLRHKVPFNSSVMTWNKNQCTWIWDHFWKDHHEYIMKYYGDDKYLGNETEYSTFPQEWIYSRLYGDGIHKPTDKARFAFGAQMVHYRPDAKICLMNGPTSEPHYARFEEQWK
jgi:hypothetical protein